jgi:acyl-CoA reductase-like NAD-dependent aldehyde dehydrogenase
MSEQPTTHPSLEEGDAERRAIEAAVAKARADTRPGIPHEQVREKLLRFADEMRRRIAALSKA